MSRSKNIGIKDFDTVYDDLLIQIARAAAKLPPAQLDLKIDAAKVLTAAKSVKNRTPDEDEGSEIKAFRAELEDTMTPSNDELLEETPDPEEDAA